MKVEKLLCPYVGCYFTATPKGISDGALDEARGAVQRHRHEKHRHHNMLTAFTDGKSWEHEG